MEAPKPWHLLHLECMEAPKPWNLNNYCIWSAWKRPSPGIYYFELIEAPKPLEFIAFGVHGGAQTLELRRGQLQF